MSSSFIPFLFLGVCHSHIVSQHATLTPNTPTSDDTSMHILQDVSIRNSTINSWQIQPSNHLNFNLKLSLNHNKWSFHQTNPTRLTLQFTVDTNTTNNLLLSFTQPHSHKYFLVSPIPNLTYPICGNYSVGNTTAMLSNFPNISMQSNITNPLLTFALENYPNPMGNNMTFTTDTMQCTYTAMDAHQSLHIYLAVLQMGNIFNIKSVNITHEIYQNTPSPTYILDIEDMSTKLTTFVPMSDTTNMTDINRTMFGKTQSMQSMNKFDTLVLIIVGMIVGIAIVLCVMDIFHSHLPNGFYRCYGCNRSDQMNYFCIFLYALAVCNVWTDVYVCYQICFMYFYDSNGLNMCIAIVSVLSIVFAYILNTVSMINIPRIECGNKGPILWFQKYFLFLILLLFFSCDCYLSVLFIKSHIFGMDLFNLGFTSIEMKKIRRTKIGTIVCSQIIIQCVFGTITHEMSVILIISILLSVILSIPFLFLWFLEWTKDRLSHYKQYIIDVNLIGPKQNKVGISNDHSHQSSMIHRYSGYKRMLHRTLCEILGVDLSYLEIGYIDMSDGYKIHIIYKAASKDGDITQLFDGKYEILAQKLKKIYHISLEWKIFVSLTICDAKESTEDNNLQMMGESLGNNTRFRELPQTTPSEIMTNSTVTKGGNTEMDTTNVNENEERELDRMSSLQNNVGSMVLLNETVPIGMKQITENVSNDASVIRDRIDTEVSDIFGVGGNDNLDSPFEIQIVHNQNDPYLMTHNIDYEQDASSESD